MQPAMLPLCQTAIFINLKDAALFLSITNGVKIPAGVLVYQSCPFLVPFARFLVVFFMPCWCCSYSMQSRAYETVGVRLSVPSFGSCMPLRQVFCCGPGGGRYWLIGAQHMRSRKCDQRHCQLTLEAQHRRVCLGEVKPDTVSECKLFVLIVDGWCFSIVLLWSLFAAQILRMISIVVLLIQAAPVRLVHRHTSSWTSSATRYCQQIVVGLGGMR